MDINPALVVVTFNRPESLKRLLDSLNNACYNEYNVPLIISIDYQNSIQHNEVVEIAENFKWTFGKKTIINHVENLGLKKHVLKCGDLVYDYDSIIMLEDDLFVSQKFYTTTIQLLNFYKSDDRIAGVSLYTHKKNFLNTYPFETIEDSNDVFFLQIASSWGQAWTKNQWIGFKEWLSKGEFVLDSDPLPAHIKNWPETSWLKYFIKYLVCTNRFFVYPKSSLSTNFGDSGSHNINKNLTYQVPLFIGKEQIKLIKIDECLNVYDSHFEILPSRLKRLCPFLTDFDFSTDIYGLKDVNFIETEYLLSSKKTKKNKLPLMTFGLEIKPMLLNIVYKINGDNFTLGYKTNFSEDKFIDVSNSDVFDYMFSHISIKSMVFLVIDRLKKRFKRYL